MRTFFVYDTAYCKADDDDPKDAVLYFFPAQIYESQCYSLCCQIVGVAKFLKSTFSCPTLITLEQEKYAVHWSGKYLFALGGTADVHESVLKQQLLFLCGIFSFYHGSINNFFRVCKNDRKEFLSRMELAWSRYITFSECFNNFLSVPTHASPLPFVKKYSEAVSKANELLKMCQLSASVIAGAVYSNSRVLLSQLCPELTSYLTLMSNENAAMPVSNATSSIKNFPPNVELKYVYLSQRVIQGVVKHNHIHVGSSVRVKICAKSDMLKNFNHSENLTSGSEGDVDSGHCTENVYQRRKNTSYFDFKFKSLLLCCALHAGIFIRDFLSSKNRIFRKYANSDFLSEKMKNFEKKNSYLKTDVNGRIKHSRDRKGAHTDDQIPSSHLLCHQHAKVFTNVFSLKSKFDHMNFSSSNDLEYSCHFCINHRSSTNSTTLLSSKNWNSEMHIPEYFHHVLSKPQILERTSSSNKLGKERKNKCKIQVLKCRMKAENCSHCTKKSKNPSSHLKRCCSEHKNGIACQATKHQMSYSPQNSFVSKEYWENIENNNDLVKSLLYVQRCENNMVVLLMNETYDENILTYLWNCGFTFLKDLEYEVERRNEDPEIESANYMLLYDNVQKVLKERSSNQASLFNEKLTKASIQAIQEDFQFNSNLKMFSLLSTNHSIFATHAKQHSAFYMQQDSNSRKPESLINLNKRAKRRIEKYLNCSL